MQNLDFRLETSRHSKRRLVVPTTEQNSTRRQRIGKDEKIDSPLSSRVRESIFAELPDSIEPASCRAVDDDAIVDAMTSGRQCVRNDDSFDQFGWRVGK